MCYNNSMEIKYQANFPPCPICKRPKEKRAKTCAFCAGKGGGAKYRRKYVDKICKYCLCFFQIPLWREKQGRGTFCSRECKDGHLTTLTGGNSIRWRGGTAGHRRGIGWKVARQWALVRALDKCEKCGAENIPLDVHHKKAYRLCKDAVEANSPSNLIVLCDSCHMKEEQTGTIPNNKHGRG